MIVGSLHDLGCAGPDDCSCDPMVLLRGGGPIPKPTPRVKRRGHRDPVTPEVAEFVASTDGMCVMAILDSTHVCRDRFGNEIDPAGEYELDHIYTLGMGRRGPSKPENLVRLCPWGHVEKTNNARRWRPALGAWAAGRPA